LVPAANVDGLGGLTQKHAIGWLAGFEFKTATFPYHGTLYVGVPKAARVAAGAEVGDEVELEVMLDETPRTVFVAPELEAALNADPELAARFEKLAFSRKRLLADPVAAAKRPETRAARVEKALAELRSRK
jgi:hypothetical protein